MNKGMRGVRAEVRHGTSAFTFPLCDPPVVQSYREKSRQGRKVSSRLFGLLLSDFPAHFPDLLGPPGGRLLMGGAGGSDLFCPFYEAKFDGLFQ